MRLSDTDSGGLSPTSNTTFSGNNTFTGNNTHSGSETFNGAYITGRQSFNATGAISATGAPAVEYTGSTASQTISLPASPTTGLLFYFENNASVTVTLGGGGQNIDGNASLSIPAGAAVIVIANAATWSTIAANQVYVTKTAWSFSGGITFGSSLIANSKIVRAVQSFTTNGATQTISATAGPKVLITGSTASSTFNLPTASLSTGQELVIVNNASVTVTLSGNGNNIDASASISMAANSRRIVSWNGTTWDLIASVG